MPWSVALVALVAGCASPLPNRGIGPDPRGVTGAADAGGALRVRFDPPASPDAVTPVTRMTVESPVAFADPRVLLVAGSLTPAQLRELSRPTPSESLLSRSVASVVWLEADPTLLVVAPLVALEPGGLYTLALSAPLVSMPFRVAAFDARAVLGRVWPDRAEPAPSARSAVWCGPVDLGPIETQALLEPALVAGRFTLGTGASIGVPRCVSWFASADFLAAPDPSPPPALAPPAVTFDDGASAALEPTVLFARDGPPAVPASCAPLEIPFGPACAIVEDDRIVVRPGDDPTLLTIDIGVSPIVRASGGGKAFTLRPLPVSGSCRIAALDRSGRVTEWDVAVNPAAPRPHVVLNEVLANPAGPEPSQEWVELYNDGAAVVSLAGFVLEDAGGRSVLPDVALAPGSFALVVSEAFAIDDGADPIPAPDAQIVRVAALGRSGLSNEGERLTLRDPSGAVVSTFPAMKTKNGVSIARIAPDAADADPASFVPSPNGSATPGARNVPP